jgi:thiol:disulfide interchange protein DsbD
VTVGVLLKLAPDWHVYWRNPGTGKPTEISWDLPAGVEAGPIQWPTPEVFEQPIPGGQPITGYGYGKEVMLLVDITVAADIVAADLPLSAKVSWLACKDSCIPGSATVALTLRRAAGAGSAATQVAEWRQRLPVAAPANWQLQANVADGAVTVAVDGPPGPATGARYVPFAAGVIDDAAVQQTTAAQPSGFRLRASLANSFQGVVDRVHGLLLPPPGTSWPGSIPAVIVDIPVTASAVAPAVTTTDNGPVAAPRALAPPAAAAPTTHGLLSVLVLAFLGGLVLNLMPCVLPVVSLKILGFVQQADDGAGKAWQHGVVFTGGVLISFWVLAGVLIALQRGGEQLGWGFHLQSPVFLTVLIVLFFVFALSLLGVFEMGLGLTSVGAQQTAKSGLAGSFFNGALATLIATPCTGPFMGAALGATLSLPPLLSLLVFTALGLGMASPYLLLAACPGLLRFVPKPGAWMDVFKQVCGFALMAVVVALLWVLGGAADKDAMGRVLLALVLLAISVWLLGRWSTPGQAAATRLRSRLGSGVVAALGLVLAFMPRTQSPQWQAFAPARVAELRAAGTPVFIDFTADWCMTCKVNESLAFSDEVMTAFADRGVVLMKADWTAEDPVITEALASFGRTGVPLYVLYPGDGGDPLILPQLLTPGVVLSALAEL